MDQVHAASCAGKPEEKVKEDRISERFITGIILPPCKGSGENRLYYADGASCPASGCGLGYLPVWPRALMIICISVASCVITEWLFELGMKKTVTIYDGSAAVTGLLLAMNLPASAPWWLPLIGGVFAILIVKQLFGGLGQNFR